jgi:thioredoxin reductase (NADPH)
MDDDVLSKTNIYDVIIIGGGPAGLTAGIYTTRARLSAVLIEKLGIGGQTSLTDKVENYPGFIGGISGPELVHNMEQQAESFGMRTVFGEVTRVDFGDESNIKKVFVDDDPAPYGGDVAIEDALFLTRFANKIYIIHRRDRLRATKILQERAFSNTKIEVVFDSVVDEIFGQTMVDGVKVKNLKTGEKKDLEVNGVFVFIGWTSSLSFLDNMVKRSDDGYILVDNEMKTSREGVFACGDCCKKNLKQIVTACGDGATAAFSAQRYVERIKGEEYI